MDHSEVEGNGYDLDIGAEAHRWFDCWLKGIENEIMDEPPIHYYALGEDKDRAWQTSDRWPLPNQEQTRFFFRAVMSGSVDSVNDGLLCTTAPAAPGAQDIYRVDYSTTSGQHSRWGAVLSASDYPNMRDNDEKALPYTTPPLETNLEVTGHPVIHLWLSTEAPDLDPPPSLKLLRNPDYFSYVELPVMQIP